MTPVRTAHRPPQAKAALSEIETVARGAPHAVVGHPAQVALVDSAAQDELFDQMAHGVVGQRADERGARPKQRRKPRATLYSPPPSQTSNERVVRELDLRRGRVAA